MFSKHPPEQNSNYKQNESKNVNIRNIRIGTSAKKVLETVYPRRNTHPERQKSSKFCTVSLA
jgi:hypothetical protein